MKWFLEETVEPHPKKIQHGNKVLFMGSCFSENIYDKGRKAGLSFLNSKFGTLFHPIPIARVLTQSIENITEERILERNGKFYSWDAYTKLNASSREDIINQLKTERENIHQILKKADFLFITFGSSKSYSLDGEIVANCHKFRGNQFVSKLTPVAEILELYLKLIDRIRKINPNIEIVLTVSPVRHSKEGLITNNRSKARLLLLCEELAKSEKVSYFPAYEMVIDELRDYRFYGQDMVHPNNTAVDYVWGKFQNVFLSSETKELANEVSKRRLYFDHLPSSEESKTEKDLRKEKEQELRNFLKTHPQIVW